MSGVKAYQINLSPFQDAISGSALLYDDTEEIYDSTTDKVFEGMRLSNEVFSPDAFDELSVEDFESNPSQVVSSPPRKSTRVTHFVPRGTVKSRFIALQNWEGIVTELSQETFFARLVDSAGDKADLEAEFAIEEVHHEDKKLVHPGAVFYWAIGYKEDRGQRIRASLVRFRRLPAWRKHELEAAERDAKGFEDLFEWQ
jgi:hypothetical protein